MFEFLFANNRSNHRYSLASTGLKIKNYEFLTRAEAESKMYEILAKKNLYVREVWDDKHFKTYKCNNGVKFYINRI